MHVAEPDAPLHADGPRSLGTLQLQRVNHRAESPLHNEHIDRYHYRGYQALPGAQLRYFVRAGGRLVALLSFGAAASKTPPRDPYIGWTPTQRQEHLHGVVNNARFLILPWIECKNLASSILARAAGEALLVTIPPVDLGRRRAAARPASDLSENLTAGCRKTCSECCAAHSRH